MSTLCNGRVNPRKKTVGSDRRLCDSTRTRCETLRSNTLEPLCDECCREGNESSGGGCKTSTADGRGCVSMSGASLTTNKMESSIPLIRMEW
jgi:hypothetical protein